MKRFSTLITIGIIILLSFMVIKPLFISGFFPMHDNTQIQRVSEMGNALRDGMFPVRWVEDLGYGYGYPIFNFYAPLAYYFGGFFTLLGIDALTATKVMIGFPVLLAGIFMFLLGKEFWGNIGGVLSGGFYLFAPYLALDLFVRGDIAEMWAYSFIPLTVLCIWKLYKYGKYRYGLLGSVAYAAIILSHNLTAMMMTPFLLAFIILLSYSLVKKKKKREIVLLFIPLFLGIMLSAFYWMPALLEMQYTNVSGQIGPSANYKDHFVCLTQLWDSPWGFGGSVAGCKDGLSLKLGKLHILLVLFILIASFSPHKKIIEKRKIILSLALFLMFTLLLTLSNSQIIWNFTVPMVFLQYPWRFLLLASFFIAFIIGFFPLVLESVLNKNRIVTLTISGLLLAFLVGVQFEIFQPQMIYPLSAKDAINENTIKWTTSKISDEYMPRNFQKPENERDIVNEKIVVAKDSSAVKYISQKTQRLDAEVVVPEKTSILIKTAYFPAWKLYLDSKKTDYTIINKGLVFELPRGTHTLTLRFEQTGVEKIANIFTICSIFFLLTGIIYGRKREIL